MSAFVAMGSWRLRHAEADLASSDLQFLTIPDAGARRSWVVDLRELSERSAPNLDRDRVPLALVRRDADDLWTVSHLLLRLELAGAHFWRTDAPGPAAPAAELAGRIHDLFQRDHLWLNNFECFYETLGEGPPEQTFGMSLQDLEQARDAVAGHRGRLGRFDLQFGCESAHSGGEERAYVVLPNAAGLTGEVRVTRETTSRRTELAEPYLACEVRLRAPDGSGRNRDLVLKAPPGEVEEQLARTVGLPLACLGPRTRVRRRWRLESEAGHLFNLDLERSTPVAGAAVGRVRVGYVRSRGRPEAAAVARDLDALIDDLRAAGVIPAAAPQGPQAPPAFVGPPRLALIGPSASGKSTTAALLREAFQAKGWRCEVLKLAKPLYDLKAAFYAAAGVDAGYEAQHHPLMESIAGHLRAISPRALADDFLKRLQDCLDAAVINDDVRDPVVDWPALEAEGFRAVRVYADDSLRHERLGVRGDLVAHADSDLDKAVRRIPAAFVLVNGDDLAALRAQVAGLAELYGPADRAGGT